MPIVRIPDPNALPTIQNDYIRQNNKSAINFLQVNKPIWEDAANNIVQGAVFQVGGTVYHCTAATAIGGVASDYIKLTPSGDGSTLAADYVADLTGVTWNSAYNGYYDVSGNAYIFDEGIALRVGEISDTNIKTVMKHYDGKVNIGNDTRIDGNLSLVGSSNVDKQIDLASDCRILWDESEDEININKSVDLVYATTTGNGTLLKTVTSAGASNSVDFIVKVPCFCYLQVIAGAAGVTGQILARQRSGGHTIISISHVGAGTEYEYGIMLNTGAYTLRALLPTTVSNLYCTGTYAFATITASDVVV